MNNVKGDKLFTNNISVEDLQEILESIDNKDIIKISNNEKEV